MSLLPALFFFSGMAALLFETLWFRVAGLSLGSTVWASSVVLAAFMTGLGVGNLIAVRRGPSLRHPLRAYAALETMVGAFGFAALLLLPRTAQLLRPVFGALQDAPVALQSLRLVVAFVLMLAPALAMGLTLPLLVRAMVDSDGDFGRALGRLYGWNTIGGVAGALAGEPWLIPRLGLLRTGLVAVALDLAVGAAALLLARAVAPLVPQESEGSRPPAPPPQGRLSGRGRRLLVAAALAGGLLLALEVVWFRFLQLYVQGTALAFAVMLAVILLGIGLGGLLGAGLCARGASSAWTAAVACAAGAATLYLYAVFEPRFHGGSNFLNDLPAILWLSLRLMFPTALASGVLFTLIGRALREDVPDPTRASGSLTLSNTIGAALGAPLAGFALLPWLGMEKSLFVLSVGYALVATLAWAPSPRRRPAYATAGAGLALAVMAAAFPFGLLQNHFLRVTLEHFECTGAASTFLREGLNETILLLRFDWARRPFAYRLVTNGLSMSGTAFPSRRYMKLFAYWPFAVKGDIRRALLISFGMGNTAAALREQPGLRSVDVVDISREILDLGEQVRGPANPLRDSRFHVHVEDGRFFLQTTARSFDLITGEPPPPKIASVANLYSREFFRLVYDHLDEGGVVTYWLPIHQLTVGDARAIVRGFCDAIPTCSLWNGAHDDWILAGVRGTLSPRSEDAFVAPWTDPDRAAGLRDVGVEIPEQLGALFIADAPSLRSWASGAPPLTDDRPGRLGLDAPGPGDLQEIRKLADTGRTRVGFAASAFVHSVWPEALRARTDAYFPVQRALDEWHWQAHRYDPLPDLREVLLRTRLKVAPLLLLDSEPRYRELAREAAAAGESAPGLSYQLALASLADRDYGRAADLFAQARADPRRGVAGVYEAFALACAGRTAEATAVLRALPPAALAEAPPGSVAWLASLLKGEAASPRPGG